MMAPSRRQTGALIRQRSPQDGHRALELFAGSGGWNQVLQAVSRKEQNVFSVELDPVQRKPLRLTVQEWPFEKQLVVFFQDTGHSRKKLKFSQIYSFIFSFI